MSMLEKLAERVREEGKQRRWDLIPCAACDYCGSSDCSMGESCPALHTPDGSLMLARWAVKLVAEELISEGVWAWLTANKDEQLFDRNAARLGKALVCLVAEAVKEAADGSQG